MGTGLRRYKDTKPENAAGPRDQCARAREPHLICPDQGEAAAVWVQLSTTSLNIAVAASSFSSVMMARLPVA